MRTWDKTVGSPQNSQKRHLLLATVSFTVCFAAWGMISAFAPSFREKFHLSAEQTAFLVAVPVLLGALARLPIGMLADRFGGRAVFTILMFFVAVPVALVPSANRYQNLLVVAFLLGMAGSSFAVGVGYVSRWYSMERQGSALGVYGLGEHRAIRCESGTTPSRTDKIRQDTSWSGHVRPGIFVLPQRELPPKNRMNDSMEALSLSLVLVGRWLERIAS